MFSKATHNVQRLVSAAVYVYALTLTVYMGLRAIVPISLGGFDLIGVLMPIILIPSLLLLPLALLLRRWGIAALLIPPVLFFVLVYGTAFASHSVEDEMPDLTVLTFNSLAGNHDFEGIGALIREADADVVLLQEVSRYTTIALPDILADDYPYQSLHWDTTSRLGLGVFSRYPLLDEDYLAFQAQSSRLRFRVQISDQLVTIYTVHLANPFTQDSFYDSAARTSGVDDLLTMLDDAHDPLLVAGDFNMTDFSPDYQRMTETLIDSFRESGSGLGLTFPANSPFPLARIDYVFHSADMHSLRAEVVPSHAGSDHYPLRVELAFNR